MKRPTAFHSILHVLGIMSLTIFQASAYERNILIEEFSTERCHNCPIASEALDHTLDEFNSITPGKINAVTHHAGFYTDTFTDPASIALLWLYNNGSTYTPAFMVDRTEFDDEGSAVFANYNDGALLRERVEQALEREADCTLDGSYEMNDDNSQIFISVTGERYPASCADSRISVYVTENNLEPRMQQGAENGYLHQHVLRGVNETWGEPIEWKDDRFEYICTIERGKISDLNNINIIAFINNYNENDAMDSEVLNSVMLRTATDASVNQEIIKPDISFINGQFVCGDYSLTLDVYDVWGRKLDNDNLGKGIYIIVVGEHIYKTAID